MKALIRRLLGKKESIFGPRIFEQQSWLDKKVNEQLLKRQMEVDIIRK